MVPEEKLKFTIGARVEIRLEVPVFDYQRYIVVQDRKIRTATQMF